MFDRFASIALLLVAAASAPTAIAAPTECPTRDREKRHAKPGHAREAAARSCGAGDKSNPDRIIRLSWNPVASGRCPLPKGR
jgi:hypothetical protein